MATTVCHCCSCSRTASSISSDSLRLSEVRGAEVKLRGRTSGKFFARKNVSLVACCRNSSSGGEESSTSWNGFGVQRREAILLGLAAIFSVSDSGVVGDAKAVEATEMAQAEPITTAVQVDELNAYSYVYPTALKKKGTTPIKWVESRKPERYSSAAPLAPDARQRIVSERIDFKNNVVVSVSVGPPNFMVLKSNETKDWEAKDVARSVLADKSTARMTTGQRVAEISILNTHTEEKGGMRYWYYEYLVQKSPTVTQKGLDVFRHSVAVTAERDGYLYSLNASTLDTNWEKMSAAFNQAISSFQLLPPTEEYVPPYKDPWRFW